MSISRTCSCPQARNAACSRSSYDHVSKPAEPRYFHDWNSCGFHDSEFDKSAGQEHYRADVFTDKDDALLFEMVNKFGVRHLNEQQRTQYDADIWLPWMFHYFLATTRFSRLSARRTSASPTGASPTRGRYRAMYAELQKIAPERWGNLSKDDMLRIISAK